MVTLFISEHNFGEYPPDQLDYSHVQVGTIDNLNPKYFVPGPGCTHPLDQPGQFRVTNLGYDTISETPWIILVRST